MGVYVKEENQPWNHKQIAGNATGDDALDATSDNNIKNKVATAKFNEIDSELTPGLILFKGDSNNWLTVYKIGKVVYVNFSVYTVDITEYPDGVITSNLMPKPATSNLYQPVFGPSTEYRAYVSLTGELSIKEASAATLTKTAHFVSGSFTYITRD